MHHVILFTCYVPLVSKWGDFCGSGVLCEVRSAVQKYRKQHLPCHRQLQSECKVLLVMAEGTAADLTADMQTSGRPHSKASLPTSSAELSTEILLWR